MRVLLALCALLSLPVSAVSQDARLVARLDAATLARVTPILAAASERGVPTEPLIQKALEASIKGASSDVLVTAVRGLGERMHAARGQLGESASEAELVAASSALFVGVAPASLAKLRTLRPDDSLAMPLIALTYFVQRGITIDASMRWVESMVSANIRSGEIVKLQQMIDTDVRAGADSRAAARTRVEALLLRYRSGG